jgi:DNA repair protein RadC
LGIKIKDLPTFERPREKAKRYGIETLSNVELLALIIGSGTKGKSAIDISYEIIYNNKGLNNLLSTSHLELEKVKGISSVTSLKIGALFELYHRLNLLQEGENEKYSQESIFKKYAQNLNDTKQEHFGIIILNSNNKILREKIIYKGTSTEIPVSCLEIIKEVILVNGKQIIVFHNHPSGNSLPSDKDAFFTNELLRELNRIGVKLIDHVVLGDNNYYSFKDKILYELTNNL